jgi:hypothetical protein
MIKRDLKTCIEESYEKVCPFKNGANSSWLSEGGWTTGGAKETWSREGSKNANLGKTLDCIVLLHS